MLKHSSSLFELSSSGEKMRNEVGLSSTTFLRYEPMLCCQLACMGTGLACSEVIAD